MRNIAKIALKDREVLFRNTSVKMGMSEAIIEKDFGVCYMLDYLFHRCQWRDNLAFKGGTSLSKAYGLIERFSEDIDLILDWRVLGYGLAEPWEERSNTKQDIFNKEANTRDEDFLRDTFLPAILTDLKAELGENIKYMGWEDYFPVVVCGNETQRAKPYPDVYLSALEKLNVNADEALAVEDSGSGSKSALAAGVSCIGFLGENVVDKQDLSLCSAIVSDMKDILSFI